MAAVNWKLKIGQTPASYYGTGYSSTAFSLANTCYFANWGDDRNDGSPEKPKASYSAALATGKQNLIGNGVFYNQSNNSVIQYTYGDQNLVFISTIATTTSFINSVNGGFYITNAKFIGYKMSSNSGQIPFRFCIYEVNGGNYGLIGATGNNIAFNSIVKYGGTSYSSAYGAIGAYSIQVYNRFVVYAPNADITQSGASTVLLATIKNCILYFKSYYISSSNSTFIHPRCLKNCYLVNTMAWRFYNEASATTAATVEELRDRCVTAWGGSASDYFASCFVGPDPFNDAANDDFTLNMNPSSGLIAATMADDFGFVGARDVAVKWAVPTDFTLENINSSGQLIATDTIGKATGVEKSLGRIRTIKRQFLQGVEAYLSGQSFDSTNNIGSEIGSIYDGTYYNFTVDALESYTVLYGSVVYGGNTYNPGQTFTADSPVGTAPYSTMPATRIRQIVERPNKKAVEWRFSRGRGTYTDITAKPSAVDEDLFYVISGSINDGTTTYNAGDFLIYVDGNTYTGTYVVEFVWNKDTETWHKFETSLANDLKATLTGLDVSKGNGETTFIYGTDVESSFQAKFAQPRVVIQVDNHRF